MDLDEEFKLSHLLLQERKCRSCNQIKDLLTDIYRTRRDRTSYSAYSYECKECTIKRVVESRKQKSEMPYNIVLGIDDVYPDW